MRREFLQALELDGGAKLPESAVEAIMAEYERSVQAERAEGRARFTARMAPDGNGTMTREQIMAIPDRSRRRMAIAENLELFEKEN